MFKINLYSKKIIALICVTMLLISNVVYANQVDTTGAPDSTTSVAVAAAVTDENDKPDLGLTSKASILMEASTGTVIFEQNADEKLSPASITKIMTLILIFDALDEGKITLEDMVNTSEYAKSMGGSQVFLEEGEQQTVETLIKCIIIASGNLLWTYRIN